MKEYLTFVFFELSFNYKLKYLFYYKIISAFKSKIKYINKIIEFILIFSSKKFN